MASFARIERLDGLVGLVGYFVGTDESPNTIVDVSLWTSVDAAEQMSDMADLQQLGVEFVELGVTFERPIVDYDSLWELPSAS